MAWLLSVYIAATVFGVGVTTLDMLGLIGQDDGDGADADADAGDGDAAGADAGDAAGDADGFAEGDLDSAGDNGGEVGSSTDEGGEAGEAGEDSDEQSSVAGHDRRTRRSIILRILSAMRNLVYFSLGFGPTGWFAVATGEPLSATLLWSGGVGVAVLGGARLLRRVLRSELSSDIKESDLLMEKGTVTVSVAPNQLGKVRVRVGGAYVDRYARSSAEETLSPGTPVRVVDLGEGCVYVEPDRK